MSEMVERLARKLCELDGHDPDADRRQFSAGVVLNVAIPIGERKWWRAYVPKARAAIEAMRNPTEAMVQAPLARASAEGLGWQTLGEAFTTMIDAALKEKPEC